jgi:hypothetical protein
MTPSKETFYFVQSRFWGDLRSNNFDFYHNSYFCDVPVSAKYIGESSTHYTMCPMAPCVAPRIKLYNELAKILYIVRNPVDRAVSNYWHCVGNSAEGRSMSDAFVSNPQYVKTGDYRYQISPYFECFPSENIRIVNFDDLVNRPLALIKSIAAWLGDSDSNALSNFIPECRRKRGDKYQLSADSMLSRLKYSHFWRYRLRNFVPAPIRSFGKRYAVKNVDLESSDLKTEEIRARELIGQTLNPLWEEFLADPLILRSMLRCS